MSDWEEAITFEIDNSFLMTRTAIILLQHTSNRLRAISKATNNQSCNALADKCDVIKVNLMKRMYRKLSV